MVNFTPTIPKCNLAAIIGIAIKVKLMRTLPMGYKIKVQISPHTHDDEENINKQINDKERVYAATEGGNLKKMINNTTSKTDDIDVYLPYLK